MVDNSGSRANKHGNNLERFLERSLQDRGYDEFWDHKHQLFENRKVLGGRQYAKQVWVGKTIYDSERKCDFLVINPDLFPEGLIIECKWQQSKGSVDEKYPFLLFNIIKTGVPTVVLLDGGGYKPTAMAFLKEHVSDTRALRAVWDMKEFQREVNGGFLG